MTQSSASLPVTASPTTPPTAAVCPYLLAADGRWRSSAPAREHRCTAVAPATIVALDKQRRLCLAPTHGSCATFLAAMGDDIDDGVADGRSTLRRTGTRPLPRTAPLVLDHGRLPIPVSGFRPERNVAQGALVVLMVVAFAAIVVARLSSPEPDGDVLAGAGGPSSTATATASMRPAATSGAQPSGPGGTAPVSETPPPTPAETAAPTPTPDPGPVIYTVRSGDTLSGIAAEFGTTVAALAELNDIDDPSRLRIGQELEIPPAE